MAIVIERSKMTTHCPSCGKLIELDTEHLDKRILILQEELRKALERERRLHCELFNVEREKQRMFQT